MKTYVLPLDCPRCGGDLTHITGSVLAGTETSAVARCQPCRTDFVVLIQLRRVEQPGTAERRAHRAKQGAAT